MAKSKQSPAEQAAQATLAKLYSCLDGGKSFRLEAGAGAGKTYSLVEALRFLIQKRGAELLRKGQQIACITYTNVASEEIERRTDAHPSILSLTIHAFCWSLIRDFQQPMRKAIPDIPAWKDKLAEAGGIGTAKIEYELGYRRVKKESNRISLHHDDVVSLAIALMKEPKFRTLMVARYPILFIDEYQDTDESFIDALKKHFLDGGNGPLLGFFGDHWQKIYDEGCGKIEHPNLTEINKNANFRSVKEVVEPLNRMRKELPQEVSEPDAEGVCSVFHANGWKGARLTGNHTKGDLPPEAVHEHIDLLKERLVSEGWDFSPNKTKILMLTHAALAREQGYGGIAEVFQGRNDKFAKKEDPYIKFFVDTVEPVCAAYEHRRYGEMFSLLGGRLPLITSRKDKFSWTEEMDGLNKLRSNASIGDVIDYLKANKKIRLPEGIEYREAKAKETEEEVDEASERLKKLKTLPYRQVIALDRFIDGHTPFSTKHGVKGAEFENVLVVLGRGWNQYNFNKMLELAGEKHVASSEAAFFSKNRNLFYVACSRSKKRLCLLFTQEISAAAMKTLESWFGKANVLPM